MTDGPRLLSSVLSDLPHEIHVYDCIFVNYRSIITTVRFIMDVAHTNNIITISWWPVRRDGIGESLQIHGTQTVTSLALPCQMTNLSYIPGPPESQNLPIRGRQSIWLRSNGPYPAPLSKTIGPMDSVPLYRASSKVVTLTIRATFSKNLAKSSQK